MHRRSLLATLSALGLLMLSVTSALAWPDRVEGNNAPDPGDPVGYYIWHNEEGWRLRTHGPGDEHQFVARLQTDGELVNVDSVRMESRDKYAVLDGGHRLRFDVHTYNLTDGINFSIREGTYLRFDLELDGQQISTESIYLGNDGRRPPSNPFQVRR